MSESVDYDALFKSVLGLPSMNEEEDPSKESCDSALKNSSREYVPSSSQLNEQPSDHLFKKLVSTSATSYNEKPATPDASSDEEPVPELANFVPKKMKKVAQKKNVLKPKKLIMNEGPRGSSKESKSVIKNKTGSKTIKEEVLELQRKRIEDADGTWVQCCNHNCLKFRYLNEIKEPIQIPPKWYCPMNKDPRHNFCAAPEENHNSDDDVFLKYVAGSIVWAKVAGYPPWPAMVDDDPDILEFFWISEFFETPTHYHVVFLDDKVSRAWISAGSIEPFSCERKFQFSTMICGKEYKHKIKPAIIKANQAMDMSIKERLLKFSFVQNYRGSWPLCPHFETATAQQQPHNKETTKQSKKAVEQIPLKEKTGKVHREQAVDVDDDYLETLEVMSLELREINARLETTTSQQKSHKKETTKQSKKTVKQLHLKEKTGQVQQEQAVNVGDNYVETLDVMFSEYKELDARLETDGAQQKPQKKDKKDTPKQSKKEEEARKKATPKKNDQQEKVKMVRKRSKSINDKIGENACKKEVKKTSPSVNIVSNKLATNAAKIPKDGTTGGTYNASSHTTQAISENKVKPVFKIKRKSAAKDPDGEKSMDAANESISRGKLSESPRSKVLKPAFSNKKVVESPVVMSSQGSQDLFPSSPVLGNSQADKEPTSAAKGNLEFNIDLLFKDALEPYTEE